MTRAKNQEFGFRKSLKSFNIFIKTDFKNKYKFLTVHQKKKSAKN